MKRLILLAVYSTLFFLRSAAVFRPQNRKVLKNAIGVCLSMPSNKPARESESIVYDRGKHIPAKICVVCDRQFTWRKKWERCWEEVTTCSKSCKAKKKREDRRQKFATLQTPSAVHLNTKAKGQKACDLCRKCVDLLVRCKIDAGSQWVFVCGPCWHTPRVANGVVDGDKAANPHYCYGGLWKNRHS